MKKQTKVLVAAAMLTLGASFSAMAAEKGTWQLEAGEWYCYDADGDVYEETWCLSDDGSKEYWVGEDGAMVTSDWADNGTYYVNSEGLKAKGEWRKLIPFEADEDADAQSFYFGTNGKKYADAKKVIDGKTYYFDEEGIMLTGWVDPADNKLADAMSSTVVYTEEEGEFRGARVSSDWVKTAVPGTAEEDKADADKFWYYIASKGTATFGKKSNINGATYFFGTDAKMLSGWVAEDGANYVEIGTEGQTKSLSEFGKVYFCGDSDDGHAQKDKWIKEYNVTSYYSADDDTSSYWFWVEKDGTVFKKGSDKVLATGSNAKSLTLLDGELGTYKESAIAGDVLLKKIDGKVYIFNKDGEMQSGLIKYDTEETTGKHYYFGESSDGARKDGSQVIADDYGIDYKFFFDDDTYAGVVGAEGGKLYNNGLIITSGEMKYDTKKVADAWYIVNKSGSIQTASKEYKDGDDVVIDTRETDTQKYVFHTGKDADGKSVPTLKGSYTVEEKTAE